MSQESEQSTWFLRTSPESVHGELTLDTLRQWAESGRILAANEISHDGTHWMPASDVAELKMDWIVTLRSGVVHGPFNLLAVPSIYRRGIIDEEAILENKASSQKIQAASLLRGLGNAAQRLNNPEKNQNAGPESSKSEPKRSADTRPDTLTPVKDPGSPSRSEPARKPPQVGPLIPGRSETASFVRPVRTASGKVSPLLARTPSAAGKPPSPEGSLWPKRSAEEVPGLENADKGTETTGGLAEQLKAKEAETVRLQQELEVLANKNMALKTRLASAPLGVSADDINLDDIHRRLKAEVHELRQQMHVSHVRAEAAESGFAETSEALQKAQADIAKLKAMTSRGADDDGRQGGGDAVELSSLVGDIETFLDTSSRRILSRFDETENVQRDLLNAVQALAGESESIDALAKVTLATTRELHSAVDAERKQWQNAQTDAAQSEHEVDDSARRRIAHLEATLAEYKIKQTSAVKMAPALDEQALAKLADARVAEIRTELQNVISALRKDNARLAGELAAMSTSATMQGDGGADTLAETKRAHEEALAALKKSHAAEKAVLENALKTARAEVVAASTAANRDSTGVNVFTLKKENVVLAQRDADQSKSIAELKSKVAGLYGEMAQRQKEALDRFRAREVQLKADVDELISGMSPLDGKSPAKEGDIVTKLHADISKLRAEKSAVENSAMQREAREKALQSELDELKKARVELTDKLAETHRSQEADSARALEASKASAQSRQKELLAEVERLKRALADTEKRLAAVPPPLSKVERVTSPAEDDTQLQTLKSELMTLRDENERLRNPAPAAKPKMAAIAPRSASNWFLRLDDGKIFGPVSLTEMIEWASDCRIGPDHEVSSDKVTWIKAAQVEELRMHWNVVLNDGELFGPLNLFSVGQLIQDGVIGENVSITHAVSGEKQSFNTLISTEIKHLLSREKELVEALQSRDAVVADASMPGHSQADDVESKTAEITTTKAEGKTIERNARATQNPAGKVLKKNAPAARKARKTSATSAADKTVKTPRKKA